MQRVEGMLCACKRPTSHCQHVIPFCPMRKERPLIMSKIHLFKLNSARLNGTLTNNFSSFREHDHRIRHYSVAVLVETNPRTDVAAVAFHLLDLTDQRKRLYGTKRLRSCQLNYSTAQVSTNTEHRIAHHDSLGLCRRLRTH